MNNKEKGFFTARNLTFTAILVALVVVMQSFGATVSFGTVSLNFTLIPIALGAILLGKWGGSIVGLACGIVVSIQVAEGLVPFYSLIWSATPVWALLTSLVKTTVAGFLAGLVYEPIAKKNEIVAIFVSSAIVPVVNTALFIVGCLLMKEPISTISGGTNLLEFILVGLVTFNFFIELGINLLVAPSLHRILKAMGITKEKTKIVSDEDASFDNENIFFAEDTAPLSEESVNTKDTILNENVLETTNNKNIKEED